MRTVSVAVVTIALVVASAIGSAGAEDGAVPASGTWSDVVYERGTGETQRGADDYVVTGVVIHGLLEMSDSRLSGSLALEGDSDDHGRGSSSDLKVLSGSSRLETDEGDWTGTFTTVEHLLDYQVRIFELHVWLDGHGAYEGYAAFLKNGETTDDGLGMDAVIYPGASPSLTRSPAAD